MDFFDFNAASRPAVLTHTHSCLRLTASEETIWQAEIDD
jgi:hypothetical protein